MQFPTDEELSERGLAPMTDEDRRLIEYIATPGPSPTGAAQLMLFRLGQVNAMLEVFRVPCDELTSYCLLLKGLDGLRSLGKSHAEIRSIVLMTIASKERIEQHQKGKGDAKQEG